MTDHGPALPRAKSTLYDAGTGIAMIVRPPAAPRQSRRSTTKCSAVSTCCPPCSTCSASTCPTEIDGMSHAAQSASAAPSTTPVAHRGLHREDLSRFVRSDSRHPDKGIQLHRELRARGRYSICRGTSPRARPARRWRRCSVRSPRPERELYDLVEDPTESHNLLAADVAPTRPKRSPRNSRYSSTTGARRPTTSFPPNSQAPESAERYTETYLTIHGPRLVSRSGDRGSNAESRNRARRRNSYAHDELKSPAARCL